MSDSDGRESEQNKTGSVIDLVSARTHRATKAKNSKKNRDEKSARPSLGQGLGSPGGARWQGNGSTKGSASLNPRATSTLFKVARILQFIVIFAGTAYLLRTCGYL